MKIGIVVSDFNSELTSVMLKEAQKRAQEKNMNVSKVVHVQGVFDVALQVKKLLLDKEIDGVATLGVVIQGVSDHDVIVANECARAITDLSLEFLKPVSLGVIGPRINRQEAEKRKKEYAQRAIDALV